MQVNASVNIQSVIIQALTQIVGKRASIEVAGQKVDVNWGVVPNAGSNAYKWRRTTSAVMFPISLGTTVDTILIYAYNNANTNEFQTLIIELEGDEKFTFTSNGTYVINELIVKLGIGDL